MNDRSISIYRMWKRNGFSTAIALIEASALAECTVEAAAVSVVGSVEGWGTSTDSPLYDRYLEYRGDSHSVEEAVYRVAQFYSDRTDCYAELIDQASS